MNLPAATQGTALVLISAVGFGTMSIFAKTAYAAGANVPTTLFLRFLLASVLLWGGLAATGRVRFGLSARQVLVCVALGAIGYAAMSLAFFSALEYVPASLASLVLYTYPPVVTLLAFILLREGLDGRKCLALAAAALGLMLVLGIGTGAVRGVGVVLALVASASYSAYIIAARVLLRSVPPVAASAIVIAAAGTTFGIYGAASGTLRLSMSIPAYAAIAGMAVVSTVLAIGAFFAGLERVGASRAAILSTVEPVVTLALAAAVLGERLAPVQVAGGACILGAVFLLHAGSGRRARPAADVSRSGET
ncbi:MAG TPA: DMT family transporter [bacterium]|nr:DMT family transporter [bacterium]